MTSEPQPDTSFEPSVAIPETTSHVRDGVLSDPTEVPHQGPELDYGTSDHPRILRKEFQDLLGLEHRLKKLGDAPAAKGDIDRVCEKTGWQPRLVPLRREADDSITHVVVFERSFTPEQAARLRAAEIGNDASVFRLDPIIDERVLGFDVRRPARGRLLSSAPVPYRELGLLIEAHRLASLTGKSQPQRIEQLPDEYVPEIPLSRSEQEFVAKLTKQKSIVVAEEGISGMEYERRLRSIQEKTGLTTKGRLVAYAAEMGLLKPPRRLDQAELDDLTPMQRDIASVAYLTIREMERHFGDETLGIAGKAAKLRAYLGVTTALEMTVVCAAHGLLHQSFIEDVQRHVAAEEKKFFEAIEAAGRPTDVVADIGVHEEHRLPLTHEVSPLDEEERIGSAEPPPFLP